VKQHKNVVIFVCFFFNFGSDHQLKNWAWQQSTANVNKILRIIMADLLNGALQIGASAIFIQLTLLTTNDALSLNFDYCPEVFHEI